LVGSAANASPSAVPFVNFYFLAFDSNGSPSSFDGSSGHAGSRFIGAGLSSSDVAQFTTDLNAYMAAWGVNRF
jgi:hypothetical protein